MRATEPGPPPAREVNFDGLVGPTHNYAGLSPGNVASLAHSGAASSPRAAALEGIAKMRRCLDLGLTQAVLPPHVRPNVEVLHRLGFGVGGSASEVIADCAARAPRVLAMASSSSAMWTANAATISPSADTADGRVHITPANLVAHFHRAIEADATTRTLRQIFRNEQRFVVHDPLPAHALTGDEGAANHGRLAASHGARGVELFVFGRYGVRESAVAIHGDAEPPAPRVHIARHTFEASRALARTHLLDESRVVFAHQHPDAIDAGVFHNDVISVTNGNVLLYHEGAFVEPGGVYGDAPTTVDRLREACRGVGVDLIPVCVRATEVSYAHAVSSYLFNSQVLTLGDGSMMILAPTEAHENERVRTALDRIVADDANPIARVEFMNLRQSMHNGGGPACLRLRVVLTDAELGAIAPGVVMTHERLARLEELVRRHYRETLTPPDLADPMVFSECVAAMRELEELLGIEVV